MIKDNSKEVIEKINIIENLDEIITKKAIKFKLDSMKIDETTKNIDKMLGISFENEKHNFLSKWLGDYSKLTEEEIIDKLFKLQREKYIFGMGFGTLYNNIKKEYLKTNYNIDWYTPEECNPGIEF